MNQPHPRIPASFLLLVTSFTIGIATIVIRHDCKIRDLNHAVAQRPAVPTVTNTVIVFTNIASASPETNRWIRDRWILDPRFGSDWPINTNFASPGDEYLTNAVRSGRVCQLFGHQWVGGRIGEGPFNVFADYHPGITYRNCRLCQKVESKNEGDWK